MLNGHMFDHGAFFVVHDETNLTIRSLDPSGIVRPNSCSRPFDVMLSQFVENVTPRQTESSRSLGLRPLGCTERPLDERFFERRHELAQIQSFGHHFCYFVRRDLASIADRPAGGLSLDRHGEVF